jgi:hypothetical protein
MTAPFTVVSFYTRNWIYPEKAQEMIGYCRKLGLAYDIQERGDTGKWRSNTALKPKYIREMLDKYDHILWVDCDSVLFKQPTIAMNQPQNVDIMACPHRVVAGRDWHVGIMSFRSNERTKAFVDAWIAQVEKNIAHDITDERAFMILMENHPEVQFLALPDNYHRIINLHPKADLRDAVFGLYESTDADKQKTYRTKDRLEWL